MKPPLPKVPKKSSKYFYVIPEAREQANRKHILAAVKFANVFQVPYYKNRLSMHGIRRYKMVLSKRLRSPFEQNQKSNQGRTIQTMEN